MRLLRPTWFETDLAVVSGQQDDAEIAVAEVAARHGRALHQVALAVGSRVARVHRTENSAREDRAG
jgi:hypothetical protein